MNTMATASEEAPASPPTGETWPRRIDRFLFTSIDGRTAAVMRIALAVMLPWSFGSIGLSASPLPGMLAGLAWMYDGVFLTYGYAAAVTLVALLFGLGIRPRVTGLILFVMLLPLDHVSRGRQSRQLLLFSLLAFSFVRSDAKLSLRTWLNRAVPADAGPIWPIRLMQIQLCIVYAVNAYAKATPHYMSGETLVGLSRMRPNFLIDMSDGLVHLGPIAMPVMLAGVGTVVVESYLAVGFWFPQLRWLTAVIGVVFHLMLQTIVKIFMLDWASMFLYLTFLLSWDRDKPRGGKSV